MLNDRVGMLHAIKTIRHNSMTCLELCFIQHFLYHRGPTYGNGRPIALHVQLTNPNVGVFYNFESKRLSYQDFKRVFP